ncbi:MAG: response regulator [Acidobacteria bacterium]|nr:response regulator [Acidobacteriota bacterium]
MMGHQHGRNSDSAHSVICPNCILVAEDDRALRKLLVDSLRRDGYRLHEAKNGREALEELRSGDAELLILDLMMPEVSGWEVLRRRAEDPALQRIPVIVISAAKDSAVVEVLDRNICALLPKPFDLDSLHALVRVCLEQLHTQEP